MISQGKIPEHYSEKADVSLIHPGRHTVLAKKKRTTARRLLFMFVAVTFILGSWHCSKLTVSKLKGTWQVINIHNLDDESYYEEWTFTSGGVISIKLIEPINTASVTDTLRETYNSGNYEMVSKNVFKISDLSYRNLQQYNYTWQIVYLKKDKLRIVSNMDGNSGLVTKEFEKIE